MLDPGVLAQLRGVPDAPQLADRGARALDLAPGGAPRLSHWRRRHDRHLRGIGGRSEIESTHDALAALEVFSGHIGGFGGAPAEPDLCKSRSRTARALALEHAPAS